ncbi:thiol-disulfide oxidoreductase DCC family protein [Flavobacterium sp. SM2513]|uniref:thiol-disulfide oxidoreductase DCC family protein n=1 Tax=Flavobacterium sp. SM2513 TaxID=3424766 RepID=UPI003D7FDAD8
MNLPENKKIILFDGVCNLCDESIQYVIKHDKKDVFRFVALQSDLGKEILNYLKIDNSKTDSIILYEPGVAYFYKSDAALEIIKELNGFLKWPVIFKIIPSSLRNPIYDYVARNRYKWYGKKDVCMIPTPELEAKFLA